jgi:hypothetical protein
MSQDMQIFIAECVVLLVILALVFSYFTRAKKPPRPVVTEGFSGTPLSALPAGKLGASIMNGVCPDCGSKAGFYEGPSGGMSTNIFCANPKCRQGFNFTNMFGTGHAERIHKMEPRD